MTILRIYSIVEDKAKRHYMETIWYEYSRVEKIPWTLISLLICVHLSEAKQTYFPESVKLILLIWWLKLDPMRFTWAIQYQLNILTGVVVQPLYLVHVRWYESKDLKSSDILNVSYKWVKFVFFQNQLVWMNCLLRFSVLHTIEIPWFEAF